MSREALALLIMVVIALTVTAFAYRNRRRPATTNDDKAFRTAPRWAGVLNEKMNMVLAGQRRLHQHIGSEADADEERDVRTMGIAQDTLEVARRAKTVSESANIAVKEVLRLLRENQQNPEDTVALEEAKTLLEGLIADDNAVLTENTPEA